MNFTILYESVKTFCRKKKSELDVAVENIVSKWQWTYGLKERIIIIKSVIQKVHKESCCLDHTVKDK